MVITMLKQSLYGNILSKSTPPEINNPSISIGGVCNGSRAYLSLNESILSRHMMLIGGTGCGKTNTFFYLVNQVKRSMTEDDVMIVFDTKGDYYKSFYNIELPMRKQMIYPPFCDLCSVGFTSLNEALTASAANDFLNALKRLQTASYKDLNIIVLGPVAPRISKIGGKFRSRIIIKCKNSKNIRAMISQLIKDFSKNTKYKNVSIYADINPENLM